MLYTEIIDISSFWRSFSDSERMAFFETVCYVSAPQLCRCVTDC